MAGVGDSAPTAVVRDPDDCPALAPYPDLPPRGHLETGPGHPEGAGQRPSAPEQVPPSDQPDSLFPPPDWGLQAAKAIRSDLSSPGRPAAPELLSMSLSTGGLTSFVLFICSPLGGRPGALGPPCGPAAGCRTPVRVRAGPPAGRGGERAAGGPAPGLPALVPVRMSDDSGWSRSWRGSPCQRHSASAAGVSVLCLPRSPGLTSRGRRRGGRAGCLWGSAGCRGWALGRDAHGGAIAPQAGASCERGAVERCARCALASPAGPRPEAAGSDRELRQQAHFPPVS